VLRTGDVGRPSSVLAALTTAAVLAAGCGRTWPKVAPAMADPAFAARQRPVTTVDILPVDLEAWTQPGVRRSADDLRLVSEAGILGAASEELLARGYVIGNAIGWDGIFVRPDGTDGVALAPDAVLATIDSLSSYGLAAEQSQGLPVPFLPARLGETTGTDATLYIGGWTFEGKQSSTGGNVAKGILLAVALVGVIVIIAAIAKSKGDGLGKLGSSVAHTAVRAGASVGRLAARTAMRAANLTVELTRGMARHADEVFEATAEVLDAWGRSTTHISVGPAVMAPTHPEWSKRPETPRKGHSRTYLELTLVDNRTGLVLWHARQQFPAHAATPGAVRRILRVAMASLPAAGVAP
jgi:hypothetical protein